MTEFRKKYLSMQFPNTGVMTICIFGDSVSHGAFECENNAPGIFDFEAVYHNQLRKMLSEERPWQPVSMINAGIAGDNAITAQGRIEKDVISHKPDLCIVEFGLNDMGETKEQFAEALGNIFGKLQSAGIEVIYLTQNMMNTYVRDDVVPQFRDYSFVTADCQNSGKADAYVQAARETAAKYGVQVADAYAEWKRMADEGVDTTALLANAINHPTREMHKLFAQKLYEIITG